MKPLILLTIFLSSTVNLLAQTTSATCDEVRKENEYLRKMLNIIQTEISQTVDNTEIRLIRASGDSKAQTIRVEFILINIKANKRIYLNKPRAIDLEGNAYNTNYGPFEIGTSDGNAIINTNVPTKAAVVFKKVLPDVKILKSVDFQYSSEDTQGEANVMFNDVKITWK